MGDSYSLLHIFWIWQFFFFTKSTHFHNWKKAEIKINLRKLSLFTSGCVIHCNEHVLFCNFKDTLETNKSRILDNYMQIKARNKGHDVRIRKLGDAVVGRTIYTHIKRLGFILI